MQQHLVVIPPELMLKCVEAGHTPEKIRKLAEDAALSAIHTLLQGVVDVAVSPLVTQLPEGGLSK